MESALKGFVAGLVFALPAGPAGILVLRSFVRYGARRGYWAAAAMALADAVVAALAAWGLYVASPALRHPSGYFQLVAGVLLVATGAGFLFFEKDEKEMGPGAHSTWGFLWPAGLVLTNPGLWAAYGSLLLAMDTDVSHFSAVTAAGAGAGLGVLALWSVLGSLITHKKSVVFLNEARVTRWADRVTGYLLILMGSAALFLA